MNKQLYIPLIEECSACRGTGESPSVSNGGRVVACRICCGTGEIEGQLPVVIDEDGTIRVVQLTASPQATNEEPT